MMIHIRILFLLLMIGETFAADGSDFSQSGIRKVMEQIPERKERSPEKIAEYIADNVTGEAARSYAIYYYVANALEYNFKQTRRVTLNASRQEIVEDALRDRVGVCQHYAELFHAIAQHLDFSSIVVAGYTRQNGKIVDTPHAWNALKVNGEWMLFDPTWASGYLTGEEYTSRYTSSYFMVAPDEMIAIHMPFDPMMQFFRNPISHFQFLEGDFSEGSGETYDLEAMISNYFESSDEKRLSQQMKRIREHGIINEMTEKYYNFLHQNYNVHYANRQIDRHNEAVQVLNEVVDDFNSYVQAKNKNRGVYPASKSQTLKKIQSMKFKVEKAEAILEEIEPTMKLQEKHYKNLQVARDLQKHIVREKEYVNKNK